ncbi:MAG: pilus assembly protein [Acidimicrobiia bacterium]|nr:pilus assembly protein [Acidimicrobiia bacterium]
MRLRHHGEAGVAAVEMAMVALLLVTLVLGIVEASWAFAQQNAVRGLAREGARTAAAGQDFDCAGADVAGGATCSITVDVPACQGTRGNITVTAPYNALTGFFGNFNSLTITSTVDFVVVTDEDSSC